MKKQKLFNSSLHCIIFTSNRSELERNAKLIFLTPSPESKPPPETAQAGPKPSPDKSPKTLQAAGNNEVAGGLKGLDKIQKMKFSDKEAGVVKVDPRQPETVTPQERKAALFTRNFLAQHAPGGYNAEKLLGGVKPTDGNVSAAVKGVQEDVNQKLIASGKPLIKVDGAFGEKTLAALKAVDTALYDRIMAPSAFTERIYGAKSKERSKESPRELWPQEKEAGIKELQKLPQGKELIEWQSASKLIQVEGGVPVIDGKKVDPMVENLNHTRDLFVQLNFSKNGIDEITTLIDKASSASSSEGRADIGVLRTIRDEQSKIIDSEIRNLGRTVLPPRKEDKEE